MHYKFPQYPIFKLEKLQDAAISRDETLFYQRLIALKPGLAQEKL